MKGQPVVSRGFKAFPNRRAVSKGLVLNAWTTLRLLAALTLLVAFPVFARADFDPRQNRYTLAFEDPYSDSLVMQRVYHSAEGIRGMFGAHWGASFETRLSPQPDESLVVDKLDTGESFRFTPVDVPRDQLDAAIREIANAALRGPEKPENVTQYIDRLRGDALFRYAEWRKYAKEGRVKAPESAVAAAYAGNRSPCCGEERIVRDGTGYRRFRGDGRVETFTPSGKLAGVTGKGQPPLTFTYDEEGRLARISSGDLCDVSIAYNVQGLASRIAGRGGRDIKFEYDPGGRLVSSSDPAGPTRVYEYDGEGRLTASKAQDSPATRITYWENGNPLLIRRIDKPDGRSAEYAAEESDGGLRKIFVTREYGMDGRPEGETKQELLYAADESGKKWLKTRKQTEGGEEIYEEYTPSGLVTKSVRGGEVTLYRYDAAERVVRKESPYRVLDIEYAPAANKISHFRETSRADGQTIREFWYAYDPQGNLMHARDSRGRSAELSCDAYGRIVSLSSDSARILFEYGAESKPVVITQEGVGRIRVEYAQDGSIMSVKGEAFDLPPTADAKDASLSEEAETKPGSADRRVALTVTRAFQNLLELVRPAGIKGFL